MAGAPLNIRTMALFWNYILGLVVWTLNNPLVMIMTKTGENFHVESVRHSYSVFRYIYKDIWNYLWQRPRQNASTTQYVPYFRHVGGATIYKIWPDGILQTLLCLVLFQSSGEAHIALLCDVMHIILPRNCQHFADSFHQRRTPGKKSTNEENAAKLEGCPNFKFHLQLKIIWIWWLLLEEISFPLRRTSRFRRV